MVTKERALRIAGFAIPVLYLLASFLIVGDYGITYDEPTDFGLGHKYLYYFETGHYDLHDDLPAIPGHPYFYQGFAEGQPAYNHWPFADILSAMTCDVFFSKLGVLAPIPAHHEVVPILVAVLALCVFLFVSKYFSTAAGVISVLALLTYPRFFGHSFSNVKDVPEIVFFSLTLMAYAHWTVTRRTLWLWLAFIVWGFALWTKVDAVMIPPMLLLWQFPEFVSLLRSDGKIALRTVLVFLAGSVLVVAGYFIVSPPLSTFSSVHGKLTLLYQQVAYIATRGVDPKITWNLYSEKMVGLVTPVLMLVFALAGLYWTARNFRKRFHSLLLIWLLVPILRHTIPHVAHYNGIRLYMTFVVPFAIITSMGVIWISSEVAKRMRKVPSWAITLAAAILAIAPNAWAIASSHPYETTYFNVLDGGFGGAQRRGNTEAWDYWLNSYKAAGAWLDAHAAHGANYGAVMRPSVLAYSVTRPDLVRLDSLPTPLPPDTYVVTMPDPGGVIGERSRAFDGAPVVYELRHDGGELFSIHYKPAVESPTAESK